MKIDRLGGGGSDFAAFVQHVGIPAAVMSFDNGTDTIFFSELFSKNMR